MITIAYLNSEYPSLSHTFIEREIRAIRNLGIVVKTFSVRPATNTGRLGATQQAAAQETIVIQVEVLRLIIDLLAGAFRSPRGLFRTFFASQKLSPPGFVTRLRHAVYVVEGVRLANVLSLHGIRHIHVHMANNGAAIAMMACVFDPQLSYSLSVHGSAEFFHVDSWTLSSKVKGALFVRCISNFCKAQIMAWVEPNCWEKLGIVHCGIDTKLYVPNHTFKSSTLRLLTIGRMHPIKGYMVLLEACKLLVNQGVEFELMMVGDGPLMASIKTAIVNFGLIHRVHLAGPVPQEEMQHFFDKADVMVVSSFMEGVPVVLMEAMANELGVVATRVGGIPELVEHGVTGWLVDPGSATALAHGIKRYAAQPKLFSIHGHAGREVVLAEYGIDRTGSEMLTLFSEFLKND